MEKRLKKKYENKKMSNGKVKPFFTSDITSGMIEYYCKAGFEYIFEAVKPKKTKND